MPMFVVWGHTGERGPLVSIAFTIGLLIVVAKAYADESAQQSGTNCRRKSLSKRVAWVPALRYTLRGRREMKCPRRDVADAREGRDAGQAVEVDA